MTTRRKPYLVSRFDICIGDGRNRVIPTKTEAFNNDCLNRTVKFPKGVMIEGCILANDVGRLQFIDGTVNAEAYKQILKESLLLSIEKLELHGDWIFQQDGASYHTEKLTEAWFEGQKITVLPWSANSLDLNILENVLHHMKRYLRDNPQNNTLDLKQILAKLLNKIFANY